MSKEELIARTHVWPWSLGWNFRKTRATTSPHWRGKTVVLRAIHCRCRPDATQLKTPFSGTIKVSWARWNSFYNVRRQYRYHRLVIVSSSSRHLCGGPLRVEWDIVFIVDIILMDAASNARTTIVFCWTTIVYCSLLSQLLQSFVC